jgi:hypothetical protein
MQDAENGDEKKEIKKSTGALVAIVLLAVPTSDRLPVTEIKPYICEVLRAANVGQKMR